MYSAESTNYPQSKYILAAMRDRASVNGVAIQHIKIMFPNLLGIGCYSHTLDIAGDKFEVPTPLSK